MLTSFKMYDSGKYTESGNLEYFKLLNNILIEYNKFPPAYINFKMITDDLLKLSGAKYTYITILNEIKDQVTVESVSGEISQIKKACKIIGFDPIGSIWKVDEEYISQIKSQKFIERPINNKIFRSKIMLEVLKFLKKRFKLGDFLGIGLFYNEELLGGIFMIMPPGETLANPELIELFSKQVSIVLSRYKAELELKNAKEKAEELCHNKSEYIANMSHELRTPLNVMFGAIQLFESYLKNDSELCKEKVKKHLKSMNQNCFRLLRLVNNLIDTSKIDAGFCDINLQNCDIVEITEGITLSVCEYIKQKGIELVFETNVEKKIIACDIDMIERIILNLLSNAFKFTKPNGFICVSIIDGDDFLTISVKDNGIGIAAEKQGIIFERYKQLDKLLTRENEGSGIGLSLIKSIIELHGGNISVKSECGVGSEFLVELPIKVLPQNSVSQENTNYLINNERLIERMNVEFADIYK